MNRKPRLFIALLRIAVGWFFFYQGVQAILNPSWSLSSYIQNASTFPHFYAYVAGPTIIVTLSYIVKALFIIIGGFLILGLFVRIGSLLGFLLMLFFYFPLLSFPYVKGGYYIVDDHIIYALLFLYFFFGRAGEYFGLGTMFRVSRY